VKEGVKGIENKNLKINWGKWIKRIKRIGTEEK
jgi:hypothetical protein